MAKANKDNGGYRSVITGSDLGRFP